MGFILIIQDWDGLTEYEMKRSEIAPQWQDFL